MSAEQLAEEFVGAGRDKENWENRRVTFFNLMAQCPDPEIQVSFVGMDGGGRRRFWLCNISTKEAFALLDERIEGAELVLGRAREALNSALK